MNAPRHPQERIFSIGLLKTGTSTLRSALRRLGLQVINVDKTLRRDIYAGRLDRLFAFFESREEDVFRGWPLPLVYQQIFERYGPRARFIMTVRKNPETWVRSLKTHFIRRGPLSNLQNLRAFGRLYPHGQERYFAQWYETYVASVRGFLRERGAEDQLLELCWEKGDGWEPLCAFLGKPIPEEPFPHTNRSADLEGRTVNELINRVLAGGYVRMRGRSIHRRR